MDMLTKIAKTSDNVKPVILDVGCGTGMLLEDLSERGNAVGLDFSTLALNYCKTRGLNKLGRADGCFLPIKSNSVDIITALDLIEHVKDDHGLMNEFQRVLKPGGVAIMSVPAHKSLWSNHDVALHHFRRYEKPEFLTLVKNAGLNPIKYSYGMATAFFPAVALRTAEKLFKSKNKAPKTNEFPLPGLVNSLLKKSVYLESRWLAKSNLPFGLSLLCIAKKES